MKMLENQIAEMLDQLASKLGVASAKVWEWSLLQVKVEIVTDVVLLILSILFSTILAIAIKKFFKKSAEWKKEHRFECNENLDTFEIALVFGTIFVVVFDFVAFLNLSDMPQLLINPEYSAFQNIIEQLGKLK